MLHERMTTNELFTALEALKHDDNQDLLKELQVHQLELEIQNRELRETQQQLAHSRLRYADLYDFSPIGYASLSETGVIEEINITGGKLLGANPHKLVGRAFTEFIDGSDVDQFNEYLRRCRYSRKKRGIELGLVPIQGSPIDIELFAMPTQDADRHTLQFRTAMIDVTMRKRAEAAVREAQRKLEQIVAERTAELTSERRQREDAQRFLYEASSILSISLDYDITLWTLARAGLPHLADACVVDAIQEDGSIKRVAVAHVRPEREAALWDTNTIATDSKVIRTGQAELHAKSLAVPLVIRGNTIGSVRLILEREHRQYNQFDLALAEDLADRAAIALDNSTLYKKELEANRLKDEFLAMVSHELRTPLTPILGAIYKLRTSRPADADLQTALDMIERNARAQARIVEDLLDISRITTGKLDFNRQPTDLRAIVESAVEAMRPSAEALGIHLHQTLDTLPRVLWCDRDRIQQVVWNLLSNSIKFTRQGGTVDVRLESKLASARIRISDTGIGINSEFLPHVFEQFRQGGNFMTRTHGGLGVGLAIVRYIVERHGGTVRAESLGEEHGAAFVVDLPYS
jgi:PAS domain S-box-containing protein